jgi:cytidylate kinase
MTIVTVSGLSFSASMEISRAVADRLELEYVDDEMICNEAAERFQSDREKLHKAFYEAPSWRSMSGSVRKRLVALLVATAAERFLTGNVVHRGNYGYMLVQGIAHALKVRVKADMSDRVARRAEREQCTPSEAEKRLRNDDKHRLSLAKEVFGTDDDDEKRFDLVVDASQMSPRNAAELIVEISRQKRYQPMTYSLACMRNVELAHRVRAALIDLDVDIDVQADGGKLRVRTRDSGRGTNKRVEEIRQRAMALDGVEHVDVVAIKDIFNGAPGRVK